MQFDHRLMATATAAVVLLTAVVGLCATLPRVVRVGAAVMGGAVAVQYGLGVETLLGMAPAGLATAHQAVAVLLLTAMVVTLHLDRRLP